ncbi:TonB-dependent receptor plug domain-containing protein [Gluconacetobacter tumulisoli]|uniref:TonB-dependent receptor n=1 Tax=Gluconacetobacter tumulisoli TaxID=1286189 RepID=A0A7W4K8N7_9PROT|nr:TonB-dependent receptor [Gluconacetobacter tumulisoli]MBB2202335.1 TonB-dependent receptor [Gluconacetobacter tumulisoli]
MSFRSKRFMLMAVSAFSGTLASSAFAQTLSSPQSTILSSANASPSDSTSDSTGGENVVVTGSFLRSSNNTSANPVQTITSREIQQAGSTTLGDYLQRLPSIGSSGTNNNQTNGTDGLSCTDLRNLGSNRVLVLIDGKRTTSNGVGECVDMNSIPAAMIQSIEILKDGGSELYGADAVSGVINIKLRHDVTTGNITVRGGISGHGDNDTGLISGYKGFNFDHGKGNLTLFGSYMSQGGVMQRDRSWATPVQSNNPSAAGGATYGSAIPPNGQYFGTSATSTLDVAGSPDGTSFHDFTSADRYNYGNQQQLLNQLQNSTLSGDLHYEINKHFNLYANVLYSHRTSSAQMAPEPVVGAVPPSDMPASVIIPANDPYNPFGEDVQMYKRLSEFGNRRTETASDTTTVKWGVNGEITHGWNYDVSYTWGTNLTNERVEGVGSYVNLLQEYGLRQVDPSDTNSAVVYDPSVCNAAAGCVLSNPFATLSPAATKYANYTSSSQYYYQMRDLNARIHNDHVVKMPYEHGGNLGIALGMEHRGEQLAYHPDPLIGSGQSLTDTAKPTGGGFNVTEGYIEGSLNLLRNAFLAHDLTIDAQGRYSSYNTFGSIKNWKASIDWAPTRDIRFRGTLGTSVRQPSVYELYQGQLINYASATDPCAQADSYGGLTPTVVANCARAGINTSTFQDANSGQIPTLTGGNPKLAPETGRTYTFGTVITPRWVPGLSTSVTYWHYTIENLISALPTQTVVNGCYTGTSPGYCSDIVRYQGSDQIDTVSNYYVNQGGLHESGIDWDLDYHFRVTPLDSFTISNNFQQLVNYKQQYVAGGPWVNLTGALLYQGTAGISNGQPKVRDYATLTWFHGPFSVTYMMQYIGGMRWNDGTNFLTANGAARYKSPAMVESDLSFAYRYRNWAFLGGIQNIANKNPPFVASATENSNAGQYGNFYVGRYFFLQAGVNF